MDAGGTIPWMESVESSLEQRPIAKHDSRDGGGRNASGTAFEEPEPSIHNSLPLHGPAFEKGENDV